MIAHDPGFVILSTTIAILGAFTACVMMSNLGSLSRGERRGRLLMASVSLGGSLWVMQFVGLLSLESPLNLAYNPILLTSSAALAFAGTTASLLLVGGRRGAYPARLPIAAAVFGATIAATNYLGIAAIAGSGLSFSWFLTLISIGVSAQVAGIVLWFLFRRRGVLLTVAGAIFLGLCLTASHYLTVASTQNLEQTLLTVPAYENGISERYLAWSATIMMYLICSICLCIFVISQFRDETD
jgi:NO-binding membrane sensor protein with MHYT domain